MKQRCARCGRGLSQRRKTGLCAACYIASVTGPETPQAEVELVGLWHTGLTCEEIGKGVGLSRERVRQRIQRATGAPTTRHPGWSRESLVAPSERLSAALGLAKARMLARCDARRQRMIAVLRELNATLGRTPTSYEVSARLNSKAHVMAKAAFPEPRPSYREAYRLLCAEAGLVPRPPGTPGHRKPSKNSALSTYLRASESALSSDAAVAIGRS